MEQVLLRNEVRQKSDIRTVVLVPSGGQKRVFGGVVKNILEEDLTVAIEGEIPVCQNCLVFGIERNESGRRKAKQGLQFSTKADEDGLPLFGFLQKGNEIENLRNVFVREHKSPCCALETENS